MSEVNVVYAWVLDGHSQIYVTDEALDDAYAVAQGFLTAYPGLVPPTALPAKTNLRTLYPEQTTASIKVTDIDRTLATVFGPAPSTADDLVTTLEAGDTAGASLFGLDVGTEHIDGAGGRRKYSCIPGFAVGRRHLGTNEAFTTDGEPSPVSSGPVLWDGRRCAVYRVELVAGVWQTLAAARRIWWGTMRGLGTQHMHTWTFGCHGPESWAGANLGTGNFQGGKRCIPLTTLADNGWAGPTLLQARLSVVSLQNSLTVKHTYVLPIDALAENTSYLDGAASYADIVAAVELFLDDQTSSVVNGSAFDTHGNDITFETAPGFDGLAVKWNRGDTVNTGDPFVTAADITSFTAELRLTAHEDVWRALGYDVRVQNSNLDPVDDAEQYGQFGSSPGQAGYWEGTFRAANAKAMGGYESNEFGGVIQNDYYSGGSPRLWPPLYKGGAVAFTGLPGQEFQLDEIDELRMVGSLSRPIMADPDVPTSPWTISGGVGEVTHQGLLVLKGPYRRETDADQVDPIAGFAFEIDLERSTGQTIQVARVCFRSVAGLVVTDSDGLPRVVVYEWLDPRLFGFPYLPLDGGTWAGFREPPPGSSPITARALVAFEYSDEGDNCAAVMRRMMLSTGTATGWFADAGLTTPVYGLGAGSTFLDVGDNDDGADLAGDAEVAQLGMGIPASMVADAATFDAAFAPAGDLGRCKVVNSGAASSPKLISALLGPAGVGLGFADGKFTPFDAWAFPTPDEAVATITPEDYAIKPKRDPAGVIPAQQLRRFAPIDILELRARVDPVGGSYLRDPHRRTSSDLGSGYRAGASVVQRVAGDHLISDKLDVAGNDWEADVASRWRDGFNFWAAPHTVVPLTLRSDPGLDIWPGDGVLVSDPWLLNSIGIYGVTAAAGRVLSRNPSPKNETVKLEVMVGAETEYRLWAPSAVVYRYDEQDLGPDFRLLCEDDDLLDRGGLTFDVDGFGEPVWSTAGGSADIELFQFDGVTWTRGIFGQVASVAGLVGASTMTLAGALTGAAFLPDLYTVAVLRTWASQTAQWVKDIYAPVCDELGQHSGGVTGSKWRGV